MMQRMIRQQNKKTEEKIKELKTFIERFSANKSKSRQATSRRKLLDNLTVEQLPASSRRYPFIGFDMDRELGKEVLQVNGISKTVDGVKLLNNVSFTLSRTDKVAFIGESEQAITMLFKILMEEEQPDEGTFKWGVSTSTSYFPVDNPVTFPFWIGFGSIPKQMKLKPISEASSAECCSLAMIFISRSRSCLVEKKSAACSLE